MSSQPLSNEDREALTAYLDGELDARSARDVEAKLNRDPRIRAEADALGRTWQLLDYLPRPAPSSTFTSRTMERVSASMPVRPRPNWSRWKSWGLGAGWAAGILLAAALGYSTVARLARGPGAATVYNLDPVEVDRLLLRDLRVIENKRLYEHVDSLAFLRELADDPDLFADER